MSKERFDVQVNSVGDKMVIIREDLVAISYASGGNVLINQKDPWADDSIRISREDLVTLARMVIEGEI